MKTIAFISNKGGTGKTTLAVNMAAAAFGAGFKVLIGDLDPQRCCIDWANSRARPGPEVSPFKRGALFPAQFAADRAGTDLMILDAPAASPEIAFQAAKASDLAILVVRPSIMDLRTMADMVSTIRTLRVKSMIVLNQAPSQRNGQEAQSVLAAVDRLNLFELPLAPMGIRSRMAFQASIIHGLSASEMFPQSAACAEVMALWHHIAQSLSLAQPAQGSAGSPTSPRVPAQATGLRA
jgi:chromosome partitioning protein